MLQFENSNIYVLYFFSQLDHKPEVSVDALMQRMRTLSQKQSECSETELNNRFKTVEMQAHELPDTIKVPIIEIPENINHFIEDPLFTYQDFSRRGAENVPSTFRVQDYSWDDHGFSLVNRLYNDVGDLLDVKFRAAYNLTYFTMADKTNVDTSKFRRAIWNYIQCIYGIRHDDYDYGEVNQVRFDCFLIRFKRSEYKIYPEIMMTSNFRSGHIFHSEQSKIVRQISQSRLFQDF